MYFQISWLVFLKVKNEFKAMKLLKQFEGSINQQLLNINLKPSNKDSSLIDATFNTQYEFGMEIEKAVFDVLQRVNKLSYSWSVYSPSNISNEEIVWTFEGFSNSSRITGIEWIQFILQTNTIKEYGWKH
jgi:hypothetical protein